MAELQRIKLNKKDELTVLKSPLDLGITFIQRFGQLTKYRYDIFGEAFLWICPDCGAELYSSWSYVNPHAMFMPVLSQREPWQLAQCEQAKKEIKDEHERLVLPALKNAKENSKCPICGASLGECNWHLFGINSDEYISYTFENIHKELNEKEIEVAKETADRYIEACKCNITQQEISEITEEISISLKELKNYLKQLIVLEKNIYALEQHLPYVFLQKNICDKKILQSTNGTTHEYAQKVKKTLLHYEQLCAKNNEPEVDLVEIEKKYLAQCICIAPQKPTEPNKPVLKQAGLFNKKRIQEENRCLTEAYEAAQKEYQLAMEDYECKMSAYQNERLKQLNAAKAEYKRCVQEALEEKNRLSELAYKDYQNAVSELECIKSQPTALSDAMSTYRELVERDVKSAQDTLLKLYQARETMYGCGVVYGKYRNFVAVSTFYDYIASGRCESLEGAAGAYNLYESELRSDRIISELTKIEASLETIKEKQYLIYTELKNINKTLGSLESSMDKAVTVLTSIDSSAKHCAENSDVIAYNTAATAYYSKVNAELTNALGYMIAFH